MKTVGIFVGIMAAVFAIVGLFVGGVWQISNSITSSVNGLRIEIKSDMNDMERRLAQKIEDDIKHAEERLTKSIEGSKLAQK